MLINDFAQGASSAARAPRTIAATFSLFAILFIGRQAFCKVQRAASSALSWLSRNGGHVSTERRGGCPALPDWDFRQQRLQL